MKKRPLLFLLPLIASFALTSCDLLNNLMPNTPIRRSSKNDSSEVMDNSNQQTNSRSSSSSSRSSSSYHRHRWGEWVVVYDSTCLDEGLEERECYECGAKQTAHIPIKDHEWREDLSRRKEPTCTDNGYIYYRCSVCGSETWEDIPALGHIYAQDENGNDIVNWQVAPSCSTYGQGTKVCIRCGEQQTVTTEGQGYGHEYSSIKYSAQPGDGISETIVNKCRLCGHTEMKFDINQVTSASKSHLVFENYSGDGYVEEGARFWGRPIGNAMAIDHNGVSINQQNGEILYSSTETGDYIEFAFNLTSQQVTTLTDACLLYCDAKPADYLNGTDFWAYGSSNTEWTPGYYIDGADDHVQKDSDGNVIMVKDHRSNPEMGMEGEELDTLVPFGKRIERYRYALYVDNQIVDFDSDFVAPTRGSNTNMVREEFAVPYVFHLHAGYNNIRLHMAGGYRSTFFHFSFRPYVEPTPITVNEAKLQVREGKTVQITSSMTDLRYESSNTSICTVDANGVVTGIKAGTATITVSKEGNYKNAKVEVTVIEKEGIVALALTDGVIAPEGGIEIYNSSYSGKWLRNFRQGATLTYTFQSEYAGKFDIQLGLRGSNINVAEVISVKINDADVAVSGNVNGGYNAVDMVIGQANLKVGENTMVITALTDSSLYLNALKLVPAFDVIEGRPNKELVKEWTYQDIESCLTDSNWGTPKQWDNGVMGVKINKQDGGFTLSQTSPKSETLTFELLLAVKLSNKSLTGFWRQNSSEKTIIEFNGAKVEPPENDLDFTNVVESNANDNGVLSTPEWFSIADLAFIQGQNTISLRYNSLGYSYFVCGARLLRTIN